jgi:ABC-2 type transport system permease protein
MLPEWFRPLLNLSPLTYFSRGVRAATFDPVDGVVLAAWGTDDPLANLAILGVLALLALAVGAMALPRTD